MRRSHLTTSSAILGLILLISAAHAWADAEVYIRSSGFSPSSVSISVGEVVYFIVADDNGPYCVQSTIGAWTPWYLWDYGESFGIQFNERGDYYYRDAFDYSRTGVIHVGTGVTNIPPSVIITSPNNGDVFTEPASFTFAASASDMDDGIGSVEFYIDFVLVDTAYATPFSTQISSLAAGYHTLTVIAHDTGAGTATESMGISVEPSSAVSITLASPKVVGGQFQFQAAGLSIGKQAVLQGSSSLGQSANWISLQTNTITEGTSPFSSPTVPGTWFFRVLQLP